MQVKIIPAQQMRQLTVQATGMTKDLKIKIRDNKAIVVAVNNISPIKCQAICNVQLLHAEEIQKISLDRTGIQV